MAKAIWAHCHRSSERPVKSSGYQQALSIRWRHANFNGEREVQKLANGLDRRSRKGSTSHPCLLEGYQEFQKRVTHHCKMAIRGKGRGEGESKGKDKGSSRSRVVARVASPVVAAAA